METKKLFVSTPIYYLSDKLHIGHSYCTVTGGAVPPAPLVPSFAEFVKP